MDPVTVAGIGTAAAVVLTIVSLCVLSLVRRLKKNGGRPEPPNVNRTRRNIPGGSNNSE